VVKVGKSHRRSTSKPILRISKIQTETEDEWTRSFKTYASNEMFTNHKRCNVNIIYRNITFYLITNITRYLPFTTEVYYPILIYVVPGTVRTYVLRIVLWFIILLNIVLLLINLLLFYQTGKRLLYTLKGESLDSFKLLFTTRVFYNWWW